MVKGPGEGMNIENGEKQRMLSSKLRSPTQQIEANTMDSFQDGGQQHINSEHSDYQSGMESSYVNPEMNNYGPNPGEQPMGPETYNRMNDGLHHGQMPQYNSYNRQGYSNMDGSNMGGSEYSNQHAAYGQYPQPGGRSGYPGVPRPAMGPVRPGMGSHGMGMMQGGYNPNQQRMMSGQSISQQSGPTPTLNQLLQTPNSQPRYQQNSYDGYGGPQKSGDMAGANGPYGMPQGWMQNQRGMGNYSQMSMSSPYRGQGPPNYSQPGFNQSMPSNSQAGAQYNSQGSIQQQPQPPGQPPGSAPGQQQQRPTPQPSPHQQQVSPAPSPGQRVTPNPSPGPPRPPPQPSPGQQRSSQPSPSPSQRSSSSQLSPPGASPSHQNSLPNSQHNHQSSPKEPAPEDVKGEVIPNSSSRPEPSPGSVGSRSNTPASISGSSPMPPRPPSQQDGSQGNMRMNQSPMPAPGYNQQMMPPPMGPNQMGGYSQGSKMGPGGPYPSHYQNSQYQQSGNYPMRQPGPGMSGYQQNMYNGPSQMGPGGPGHMGPSSSNQMGSGPNPIGPNGPSPMVPGGPGGQSPMVPGGPGGPSPMVPGGPGGPGQMASGGPNQMGPGGPGHMGPNGPGGQMGSSGQPMYNSMGGPGMNRNNYNMYSGQGNMMGMNNHYGNYSGPASSSNSQAGPGPGMSSPGPNTNGPQGSMNSMGGGNSGSNGQVASGQGQTPIKGAQAAAQAAMAAAQAAARSQQANQSRPGMNMGQSQRMYNPNTIGSHSMPPQSMSPLSQMGQMNQMGYNSNMNSMPHPQNSVSPVPNAMGHGPPMPGVKMHNNSTSVNSFNEQQPLPKSKSSKSKSVTNTILPPSNLPNNLQDKHPHASSQGSMSSPSVPDSNVPNTQPLPSSTPTSSLSDASSHSNDSSSMGPVSSHGEAGGGAPPPGAPPNSDNSVSVGSSSGPISDDSVSTSVSTAPKESTENGSAMSQNEEHPITTTANNSVTDTSTTVTQSITSPVTSISTEAGNSNDSQPLPMEPVPSIQNCIPAHQPIEEPVEPPEKKRKTKSGAGDHMKLFEMGMEPGRRPFLDRLFAFLEEKGTPITNMPVISKQPLDLYRLYLCVQEKGGMVEVTKLKKWKEICGLVNISGSASAAFTLKKNYIKFLFAYECRFDRGGMDPTPILTQMETDLEKKRAAKQRNRAPSPGSQSSQDGMPGQTQYMQNDPAMGHMGQGMMGNHMMNNMPPHGAPMMGPNNMAGPPHHMGPGMQGPGHMMGNMGPQNMMGGNSNYMMQGGPGGMIGNNMAPQAGMMGPGMQGPNSMMGNMGPGPQSNNMMHNSMNQHGMMNNMNMPPNNNSMMPHGNMMGSNMGHQQPGMMPPSSMSQQPPPHMMRNSMGQQQQPPAGHPNMMPPNSMMRGGSDSVSCQDPFADEPFPRPPNQMPPYPGMPANSSGIPQSNSPMPPGSSGPMSSQSNSSTPPTSSSSSVAPSKPDAPPISSSGMSTPTPQQLGNDMPPSSMPSSMPQISESQGRSGTPQMSEAMPVSSGVPMTMTTASMSTSSTTSTAPSMFNQDSNSNSSLPGESMPRSSGDTQAPQSAPPMSSMPPMASAGHSEGMMNTSSQFSNTTSTSSASGRQFPFGDQFSKPDRFDQSSPSTSLPQMGANPPMSQPSMMNQPGMNHPPQPGMNQFPPQHPMDQSGFPPRHGNQIQPGPEHFNQGYHGSQQGYGGPPRPMMGNEQYPGFPPNQQGQFGKPPMNRDMSGSIYNTPNKRYPDNRSDGYMSPDRRNQWSPMPPQRPYHVPSYDPAPPPGMSPSGPPNMSHISRMRMSPNRPREYSMSPNNKQKMMGPGGLHGQYKKEMHFPLDTVEATQPLLNKRKRLTKHDIGQIEAWRIMMALKSGLLAESTWALDTLNILLYDDSTVAYFGLSHLPGLLEVLLDHLRRCLIDMFDMFDETQIGCGHEDFKQNLIRMAILETAKENGEMSSESLGTKEVNRVNKTIGRIEVKEGSVEKEKEIKSEGGETNEKMEVEGETNKIQNCDSKENSKELKSKPNYTFISRQGKEVKIEDGSDLNGLLDDKYWDVYCEFGDQSELWEYGKGDLTEHIITHLEDLKEHKRCSKAFFRKPMKLKEPSEIEVKTEVKKEKTEAVEQDDSDKSKTIKIEINGNSEKMEVDNKDADEKLTANDSSNDKSDDGSDHTDCSSDKCSLENEGKCSSFLKGVTIKTEPRDEVTDKQDSSESPSTEEKPVVEKSFFRDEPRIKYAVRYELLEGNELVQTCKNMFGINTEGERSNVEDESYQRNEPPLCLTNEAQIEIGRRCVCISNIFRSLSCIPGNDAEMSRHAGLIYILGKLLLLHHKHLPRSRVRRKFDRDDIDEDMVDTSQGMDEWWWDSLNVLRENTLVIFANICAQLRLDVFPDEICVPTLEGLLHWVVCPSSCASDPLPTVSATSVLSPLRLMLEAMCKLCIHDRNVDMLLAMPPYERIVQLFSVLTKLLANKAEQVTVEFSIVLLSELVRGGSSAARGVALQHPSISLLIDFLETAEQKAVQVANMHSIQMLRDNPEMMGTSLDMLRRAATVLLHLAKVPDNRKLFVHHQSRLLSLVMSQILDQTVASILSDVLFQCSHLS